VRVTPLARITTSGMDQESEPVSPPLPILQIPAIVERIKAGDPEGMEQLYSLMNTGIRFLLARTLPPEDVEDALHETLLTVVGTIQGDRLREPKALLGYVRAVVKHTMAAKVRSRIEIRTRCTRVDESTSLPDAHPTPDHAAAQHEAQALMWRVLKELPERYKDILTRFYVLGQGQEQILAEMNLTPDQFRLCKSKAKSRFAALGRRALMPSRPTHGATARSRPACA